MRKDESDGLDVQAFHRRRIGLRCHTKSIFEEIVLQTVSVLNKLILLEGDFGCFLNNAGEFVSILAWTRDGK